MKTTILLFLMVITCIAGAQSNKFGKGDFGLRYAVTFNGSINQSIGLSGLLTDRLELGSNLQLGYQSTTTTEDQNFTVPTISQGSVSLPGTAHSLTRTLTFDVTPYFLYHFPTKNNLDFYLGPFVTAGLGKRFKDVSEYNIDQTDFHYYQKQELSTPLDVRFGAGLMLGAQYFFYKNLALGITGNFGASGFFRSGNDGAKTTIVNSGSDNPMPANTTTDSSRATKVVAWGANGLYSGGITLAYYFGRKQKAQ